MASAFAPPYPLPATTPITVAFVAYPQMGLLDLSGAQTVFWAASKALAQRGLPGYQLLTSSLRGGLVSTVEGLSVDTSALAELDLAAVDTLVVPGAPDIGETLDSHGELAAWLNHAAPRVRRVASVCSGAFLLAKAGLLDGCRAATHWALCDTLQQRFPALEVDADAIFIQQGSVWTSAGVTAGIDLALALVEADCGREVSMQAARELVVYLKRPGGQAQYSTLLQLQTQDNPAFDELHLWLAENLGDPELTVERLAEQAKMSLRNFSRVYKDRTGRTPAKAIELFRLEAAKRLLENSSRNIGQIASACGFSDEERLRSTFQRHLSISPRDYRSRFSR
ncbi:helix-turn-helix domain-containing protein [Pseudomonas sp. PDM23]|uniref:GlxA family transcriptional regulator n=1 Tax=unclassified Pseudomonas TaxID=196821 RepID=UPI00177B68B0|nr:MULTISPECIES: helix-turn-helix domain-containing protein [unclassified Pseudomonas]MBD9505014.1 helix-turn-helix domain-containing protein [Pseudomonas sp. PDM17]MBD9578365.1 helix-turn-helix domain-containing protein [Pseudomonas sp. PDM23]MBD9673564.1 helix-turn-helix domain-containing protein [Pseudomonas sp. PDM21]